MNEGDMIFLGAIETCAYNSKMEIKLLNSYVDINYDEESDDKHILFASLNRIDDNMDKIYSAINKIKSEEYV